MNDTAREIIAGAAKMVNHPAIVQSEAIPRSKYNGTVRKILEQELCTRVSIHEVDGDPSKIFVRWTTTTENDLLNSF